MREGKCEICKKVFYYTNGKKKTCSVECRKEKHRRDERQRNRNNVKHVNDMLGYYATEAKEMGLSYGQYVAYIHGKLRIEKKEG